MMHDAPADHQPLLLRLVHHVYRVPTRSRLSQIRGSRRMATCVYGWTALTGIAGVGALRITLGFPNWVFTDRWVILVLLALVSTFLGTARLLRDVHWRLSFLVLGALVLATLGLTLFFAERCNDCARTVQRVEHAALQDFTKRELIDYIFAVRLLQEQHMIGACFLVGSGVFVLVALLQTRATLASLAERTHSLPSAQRPV